MHKLTRRQLAATAASRWERHYQWAGDDILFGSATFEETAKKLADLGPNPAPDDVDAVLGDGWTHLQCDLCKRQSEEVLHVELYSDPVYICVECLAEGLRLLGGGE